ncbi:very long chain fatty acid elongase AAEL008004-like [Zophobas morio]|uniref:very long chain fatty acid elongase AAEL008004-like n=1 Tax=Zophobas morio TaxID=2755281 RepID=UPI003082CA1B
MQSPWQLVSLVSLYTLFVFKLGPRLMKNREPFGLKTVIVIYNLAQIILNGIGFAIAIKLFPLFNFCCSPVNASDSPEDLSIQRAHFFYLILKFLDLLDTVFFVLRKKQSHVSFLHIHHHIGMVVTGWASVKYFPGGVIYYVFLWNTFIHFVMYTYYLLTSLDSCRTIWWKKYLTLLQMIQHSFFICTFIVHLFNFSCSYPKSLLLYYTGNTALNWDHLEELEVEEVNGDEIPRKCD